MEFEHKMKMVTNGVAAKEFKDEGEHSIFNKVK
jgi:hypothetical protein